MPKVCDIRRTFLLDAMNRSQRSSQNAKQFRKNPVSRARVKGRVAFVFVAVGVLVFACGPRPRASDNVTLATTARVRVAQSDASPLTSNLDVQLKNGVRFAFHVTNTTAKKLELRFPTGQTHEVIVLDSIGREVWRWSSGRLFTQSLQNHVMRQADSLNYDLQWSNAPAGHYTAVATLASANFPVEQRREFTVR